MIEFPCSCGKTLAVGEELAGKRARCPACGQVADVPGDGPAPFPGAPRSESVGPPAAPTPTPPMASPGPAPAGAPTFSYAPGPGTTGASFAGAAEPRLSMAAASGFVLGLLGCLCLTSPIGLGLSIAGFRNASRSGGAVGGSTLAVVGIALNSLWLVFWVVSAFIALLTPTVAYVSDAPTVVPADRATKGSSPTACAENLRNLWIVMDTHLAEKKQYPPGGGARFLDALERYGRDRFPRLPFTIQAPGGSHPTRTAYRGPARGGDIPPAAPLIADWEDEHPDGAAHVLYADGSIRTLRPGTQEFAAAQEATR